MSEATAVPEPENTSRSFLRVIGSKVAAGARRVASLVTRGATHVVHGATWTLDALAKVVKVIAWAVCFLAATLLVAIFLVVLFVVALVSRVVYFAVLVVRTPHLALFHRPALKADWSLFVDGLHPRRLVLLSPSQILSDVQPPAVVHDLFAHRTGRTLDEALSPYTALVTDVDAAHEAALFEELERRNAGRTIERPDAEQPKGHATPKQQKRRPTRLPRTA